MAKHKTNHHLHSIRIVLLGILVFSAFLPQFNSHVLPSLTVRSNSVLAYAVSMSRGELLEQNNSARRANGLAPFSLNSQLNSSAQAKAQHMADNNYWAHVAPDGTQPWYFFEASGYNYSRAGENLAYGFTDARSTNQGWLDSAGHRANIMGDYSEVGFGFVNSATFQGTENTIIVAHYAKPLVYSAPAPAPSAPATTPAPTPAPAPVARTSPKPEPAKPATQTPAPATPAPSTTTSSEPIKTTDKPAEKPKTSAKEPSSAVAVAKPKEINVLESLRNGSLPSVTMLSLGLTMSTAIGYAYTHRSLMRHAVRVGERYLITHPLMDTIAIIGALALILNTTVAHLQ